MKKYNILYIVSILLFCSCGEAEKTIVVKEINNEFPVTDTIVGESISMGVVCNEWLLLENSILCKTEDRGAVYSIFNLDSAKISNMFGRIGRGNGEMIAPHIFYGEDNTIIVLDNAKKQLSYIKGEQIITKGAISVNVPFNNIKSIQYPIIGYTEATPNKQSLVIMNLDTQSVIDTLTFQSKDGNSSLYDFAWNYDNETLVLAHFYANEYYICKLNKDCSFDSITKWTNDGNFNQNRIFYTDAVVSDETIYLLSQRDVNIENGTGFSEIEVRDGVGNPIKRITLKFIAEKMLFDKKTKRIFLTSPQDENLHVLQL